MSVLGRIRLFPPAAPAPPRPPAASAVAVVTGLEDGELEVVVGGLERVYLPNPAGY